ncbi:MAG: serine/threonine-protein kinase [Myxococcota bacterium]
MGGTLDESIPATPRVGEPDLGVASTSDVFEVPRTRVPVEVKAGQAFGRFTVEGELGRGGMATVLRARDETLDREVALKLLHLDLDTRHEQRLLREAKALARLSHPNVVQVYEVGEHEGQPYIAMELVRGQTLAAWQAERRPWREAVAIYVQAGRGLAAAHAQGLVHRDFKPSNAILDDEGRVRVLDFGLARQVGVEPSAVTDRHAVADAPVLEADLTRTGSVMGTLAYMAPEQRRGEVASEASDQFSFFVSLYEAIYGERPYPRDTGGIVFGDGAEVRSPQVEVSAPSGLRAAMLRGVAVDASERFATMSEALAALEALIAPRRVRWLAGSAVAAVALAGVGAAQYAEVGFRCEGADASMDAVWGASQREALGAALTSSNAAFGTQTWTRVSEKLDGYAAAWTAQHTSACEATRVTETQPESVLALRMACLEGRRAALQEAVTVLQRGGEGALYASQVVAHLPSLARCENVEALQAALPLPNDPVAEAEVAELRRALVEVRALRDTTALDESEALADETLEAARASGYEPVVAEALMQAASSKIEKGLYAEGEAMMLDAYELAARLEHRPVEAYAAAELTYVIGSRMDRNEEGRTWGRVALAISRRPNADPEAAPRAASNLADVYANIGDPQSVRAAIGLYEEAAPAWEAARGSDDPELGAIYHNLSIVHRMAGDDEAALAALLHAREIAEASDGPGHPNMGELLETLGNYYGAQGDVATAIEYLGQALAIKEAALGADHPRTIRCRLNNAEALLADGQRERSLQVNARVLEGLKVAQLPPPIHTDAHFQRGRLELAMDDPAEALPAFERAYELAKTFLPEGDLNLAAYQKWVGRALAKLERYDEARVAFQRTYDAAVAVVGESHYDLVPALMELAELDLRQGNPAAGLPMAERALAIMEARGEPPAELANARFLTARMLPAAERARARALASSAQALFVDVGGRFVVSVNETQAWLDDHPG